MTRITLTGVRKAHPVNSKYCDLADVSFTVEDGEYFCLVGPSGAGKTSTLRMIAGLDEPDEGSIAFDGADVCERSTSDRNVSFLFENLALYPNKTGYENIEHPLKVRDVAADKRERRVREIADRLQIAHLLDRKPGTFSGGEKQRVGIARALVGEPTVHLLDEPLGGLDAKLRQELRVLLKEIHEDFGETFIHVTSSQEEAMSVADRMAVVRDGTVQQIGTPTELYDDPADTFVAEFIGSPSMNRFDATIEAGSLTAGPLTWPTDGFAVDLDDGAYTVGIRPEDVTIHKSGGGSESEVATVEVTEPLGAETIVDVTLEGIELRILADQRWVQTDLAIDQAVSIEVPAAMLYVFDDSGETVVSPDR